MESETSTVKQNPSTPMEAAGSSSGVVRECGKSSNANQTEESRAPSVGDTSCRWHGTRAGHGPCADTRDQTARDEVAASVGEDGPTKCAGGGDVSTVQESSPSVAAEASSTAATQISPLVKPRSALRTSGTAVSGGRAGVGTRALRAAHSGVNIDAFKDSFRTNICGSSSLHEQQGPQAQGGGGGPCYVSPSGGMATPTTIATVATAGTELGSYSYGGQGRGFAFNADSMGFPTRGPMAPQHTSGFSCPQTPATGGGALFSSVTAMGSSSPASHRGPAFGCQRETIVNGAAMTCAAQTLHTMTAASSVDGTGEQGAAMSSLGGNPGSACFSGAGGYTSPYDTSVTCAGTTSFPTPSHRSLPSPQMSAAGCALVGTYSPSAQL